MEQTVVIDRWKGKMVISLIDHQQVQREKLAELAGPQEEGHTVLQGQGAALQPVAHPGGLVPPAWLLETQPPRLP